jgi:hypothetical protein
MASSNIASARMEPNGSREPGKWTRRVVGGLAAASIVAAIMWRFMWPVTGIYADVLLIGVIVVGLAAAKVFRVI